MWELDSDWMNSVIHSQRYLEMYSIWQKARSKAPRLQKPSVWLPPRLFQNHNQFPTSFRHLYHLPRWRLPLSGSASSSAASVTYLTVVEAAWLIIYVTLTAEVVRQHNDENFYLPLLYWFFIQAKTAKNVKCQIMVGTSSHAFFCNKP